MLASTLLDSYWIEHAPAVGEYCEAGSHAVPSLVTSIAPLAERLDVEDAANANRLTAPEGEGDPPNQVPVAEEDGYATSMGVTLKVDAPGVLANDTYADGHSLHAVLARTTEHGTLVLQENGSFTYRPDPGFNRDDTFQYRPNDGMVEGDAVTVTINIRTAYPWHNGSLYLDVNDDGSISPIDALLGINSLNRLGSRRLPDIRNRPLASPFYDTSGNGFFTPIDVLLVINHLNRQGQGEGELSVGVDAAVSLPSGQLPYGTCGSSFVKAAHDAQDQPQPAGAVDTSMPWQAHPEIGCPVPSAVHPSEVAVAQPQYVRLIVLEDDMLHAQIREDLETL